MSLDKSRIHIKVLSYLLTPHHSHAQNENGHLASSWGWCRCISDTLKCSLYIAMHLRKRCALLCQYCAIAVHHQFLQYPKPCHSAKSQFNISVSWRTCLFSNGSAGLLVGLAVCHSKAASTLVTSRTGVAEAVGCVLLLWAAFPCISCFKMVVSLTFNFRPSCNRYCCP